MKVIIDYLKANPKFTIVLGISLLACIIITVALVLIRSKRRKIELAKAEELEKQQQLENTQQKMMNSIFEDLPKIVNKQEAQEKCEATPANPDDTAFDCKDELVTTCAIRQDFTSEEPTNIEEKSSSNEKTAKKPAPASTKNNSTPSGSKEPTKSKISQPENKPESKPETKVEEVKYAGKWVIYKENDRFVADLKASNGEIMLSSESYTSLSGIKSGIETLKKNIASENYAINLDKNGNYVFKIFSTANRLLCIGEGYSTKDQCEKAFASVKRFAKTAVVVNMIEKENTENK